MTSQNPSNPAAPRRFTQGNVTEGPRARAQAERQLSARGRLVEHPAPLQSLVASAKRLTAKKLKGGSFKKSTAAGWQEDAWEMYDLVGEQHFLGSTLANQASKARFYVGVLGDGADTTDMPDATEDQTLQDLLDNVGGGPIGFSQMVQRMLVNLFVAGDGWLVGIPKQLLPDYEMDEEEEAQLADFDPTLILDPNEDMQLTMGDLEWRMLSVSEVTIKREGVVTLHLGSDASEKLEVSPDLLFMIRVWRPHPRRWWEADSPTRSSLPVLRELVGLTMHISAQVDSRLAGAGLLLVPASAARALKIAAGLSEDSPDDPFTDALMEAMLTPIGDRANASALVPLVVTVPDGTAGDFQFITFAKPLDTEARNLRDEAIRRLALGQDAPPELLLGTAGMNHWGAWLVRDDVVSTHLEPPLALIADALTTQYLRPMMAEMGYAKDVIANHVVWYDTSRMVVQPNRAADALTLYDRDSLSDEALRKATGFDETDAPETAKMDLASQKAFVMVQANPGLMANPGLPALVEQLRALISGNPLNLPKKGEGSAVSGRATAEPVDALGQPIPTTNSAPAAGGRGVGASASPSAPAAGGSSQSSAPAQGQTASKAGAPPSNPSVKQGPALAAEGPGLETFAGPGTTGVLDPEGSDNPDIELGYDVFAVGDSLPEDEDPQTPLAPQGAIVVLIPKVDDPINEAVKGVESHLTLAYLSNDVTTEAMPPTEELYSQTETVAATFPFTELTLGVEGVQPLGDAVVVALSSTPELTQLFQALTKQGSPIGQLNEARNRYEFRPHVSLGYPSEGASPEEIQALTFYGKQVTFDRVGLWIGERHLDFPLGMQATPELATPTAPGQNDPTIPAPGSPTPPAADSTATPIAAQSTAPTTSQAPTTATQAVSGSGYTAKDFLETVQRNLDNPPRDTVPESATVVRSLADALADRSPQFVELTMDNG